MFTLAHLSDPHLGPLPRPTLRNLLSKRMLGFVNWYVRRNWRHNMSTLAALTADLATQKTDHIAVTGDLAVISLEGEFITGQRFLQSLGPPDRVSFVPGNHDAYVRSIAGYAVRHWPEHMASDIPFSEDNRFPYVRRRGTVALVGLSSSVPTGPFMATGEVGAQQRERLKEALDALGKDGLFRVVLIHHPPIPDDDRRRRLEDTREVTEIIRAHGAELVLHGHHHKPQLHWIERAQASCEKVDTGFSQKRCGTQDFAPRIPIVGVPSASAPANDPTAPGAYNLYRISGEPGAWSCRMSSRGFAPDGRIVESEMVELIERLQ